MSELTEENQKYIKENQKYVKEKQIIEQELNKKEEELNKKEQELASNKKTIDNLNIEIKLLKDSDKLRKIKGSKDSSTLTKIPYSVRKRDDKARTFASEDFKKDSLPEYNEKSNRSENLENEYQKIYIPNLSELLNIETDPTKLKELDVEQIERNLKETEFYEYELNISNSRIKYLDKIIKENPKMSAKKTDIINQLKSLYTMRKDYFQIKIYNTEIKTPNLKSLDDQIRKLEDEFRDQKGSGTFTSQNKFVKLLTLLTQLLTKNNSKKFKDDINQILKELYHSTQITKEVYNILNKSILYKNDL